MNATEKIIIGADDEPTLIAEKLIDSEAKTIVFSIPAGSQFSESITNFKLIKREAQVLKKKILIESTDERVLELAQKSGIEVYGGVEIPVEADTDVVKVKITTSAKSRVTARKKKIVATEKEPEQNELDIVVEEHPEKEEKSEPVGEPVRPEKKRREFSLRRSAWLVGGIVALALVLYLGLAVLPRASAGLETEKIDWLFKQNIIVDKSVSEVNATTARIPGQLFIQKSTATVKQPATGKKYLQQKATGTLTIYNAYSSKPQGLVASTRFVTPAGIVYRLTKAVTVPGANIENGIIAPSSITAQVTADKTGEAGNTGPVEKLLIPGFAGTPKYSKFYGQLKEGATSGTVGDTKVATEADITAAKSQGAKQAEADLRNQAAAQIPSDFKVVESATKFTVLKQDVNSIADADGNFTVSTQAQLSILAFREKDILQVLHGRFQGEKGKQYEAVTETLNYAVSTSLANPLVGTISLPIDYTAVIQQHVDVANLKIQMQGQSEAGIKTIIYALPGVKSATISLWPFWVQHVPFDTGKISVVLK